MSFFVLFRGTNPKYLSELGVDKVEAILTGNEQGWLKKLKWVFKRILHTVLKALPNPVYDKYTSNIKTNI
jgi:hypothetical protein